MEIDIQKTILAELSVYRKKRKVVAYLWVISFFILGLSFVFESISRKLSIPAFIVGSIFFIFWLIKLNINCRIKCPRCGNTFCMKKFHIWCWTKRCLHCNLDLNATELSEL